MPGADFPLAEAPGHAYIGGRAPRGANHLPRGGHASMVRPRNGA
jgi:hypothetical protein